MSNPITRYRFSLPLLWLVLASSSVVFKEPAPYDAFLIGMTGLFFLLGLRVPSGLGIASLLLGVFLLANVVSSLFAVTPIDTFRSLSIRFYMVAAWLVFACLICENPGRVLAVIWSGYIVAAILATCAGIVGYFELGGNPEQLIENGRVRAFFKDPNVYGPFLVPVALYSLARLQTANRVQTIGFIGLFMFLSFGVLLGFSRGSWANFVVSLSTYFSLGYFFFSSKERHRLLYIASVFAVAIPLLLGVALSTDKIVKMAQRRAVLVQYYDAGEGGRFNNQWAVIQKAAVSPMGLGPGESSQKYHFPREPHNVYLHVLIEAGWIGAVAFYLFVFLTLRECFRMLNKPFEFQVLFVATLASIVGTLVQSFFIDSTHWRHMYLLFGMLWGLLMARRSRGL